MSENSKPEIVNCDFAFRCSKSWEAMQITEDADVRFCGTCQKNVYFAETNAILQRLSEEGKCVAVYENNPLSDFPLRPVATAGMPVRPSELSFDRTNFPEHRVTAGIPVRREPPKKSNSLLIALIVIAVGFIIATLIIAAMVSIYFSLGK